MEESYMKEEDFRNTSFIDAELRWFTIDDFLKECKIIKKVYKKLKPNQVRLYKWFCYANINTTTYQKNKIWDYLNGDINLNQVREALTWNGLNYRSKYEYEESNSTQKRI